MKLPNAGSTVLSSLIRTGLIGSRADNLGDKDGGDKFCICAFTGDAALFIIFLKSSDPMIRKTTTILLPYYS